MVSVVLVLLLLFLSGLVVQYSSDTFHGWGGEEFGYPRLDFDAMDTDHSFRYQKAVSFVLCTYEGYYKRLNDFEKLRPKAAETAVSFLLLLAGSGPFVARRIAATGALSPLVGFSVTVCSVGVALLFSALLYKVLPLRLPREDFSEDAMRKLYENRDCYDLIRSDTTTPSYCEKIIEDCPMENTRFDALTLYILSCRLAYMDKVFPSAAVRCRLGITVSVCFTCFLTVCGVIM